MSTLSDRPQIPRKIRHLLAAQAGLDVRTLERYLAGRTKPHELTVRAIREAAQALGVALEVQP